MVKSSVSLKEVAAVAGCSARVAGVVLNPGNSTIRVGEATQQRILAAASELGYRVNGMAQAMVTGKSRILGAIVETISMEHRARMFSGANNAAVAQGYLLKVIPFAGGPNDVIKLCLDWRLSGIICLSMPNEQKNQLTIRAREVNIPMVVLNEVPFGFEGISVSNDEMQGMQQVIEHLVNLGHREIGFLGADAQSVISQHRANCFRVVLNEMGIFPNESWIVNSDWSDGNIITGAINSLLEAPRPTAIVCVGDPLAMRLIPLARARGISVPQDLSVTGYANFQLSDIWDPPLTTIEQSFADMGRLGVEQIIALLEGKAANNSLGSTSIQNRIKVPTRLVVRKSTASSTRQVLQEGTHFTSSLKKS